MRVENSILHIPIKDINSNHISGNWIGVLAKLCLSHSFPWMAAKMKRKVRLINKLVGTADYNATKKGQVQ